MTTKPKLPITIGVIGHLDAVITERHISIITRLFDELQASYPHSPVCLFSQLAVGADMEVARIFLDIKASTGRDYELIVPLPFHLTEYKATFKPKQRAELEAFLAQASREFVVESSDKSTTDDKYREGGRFVADSSMLLLALWEGEENNKIGGTGDIVRYKETGSYQGTDPDHIFEQRGTVIKLYCERADKPVTAPLPEIQEPILDFIRSNADKSILRTLEKVEELNKGIGAVDLEALKTSAGYLYPASAHLSKPNTLLRSFHAQTDTLAMRNQRAYNGVLDGLFLVGLFIIGVFEWYKHLSPDIDWLLWGTLGLILLAYGVAQLSHRLRHHMKFLENRVLAEAIRIQFFWNLGGVKRNVAKYILRLHKAEFSWIKHLLLAIDGLTYQPKAPVSNYKEIRLRWLNDQFSYFDKKIKEVHRLRNTLNNIAQTAFFLAIGLMVTLAIPMVKELAEKHHCFHPVIVTIGCLLGIFALGKAYIAKKGFHQITNQYVLMKEIYQQTMDNTDQLQKTEDDLAEQAKKINRLYYLAGKEALIEIGSWYLIFKDKEPEAEVGA